MTDSQGKELHVGDHVMIPCVVVALHPECSVFTVDVQVEPGTAGETGYHPIIGLSCRQLRHRAGRPPKRVRPATAR